MIRLPAIAAFLLACLAPAAAASAQPGASATAPATAGSAQRRAILDALRPAIEARLGPDVEFVVASIRVRSGWALVVADPQRRGGRPIDGRRYFGADFEHMDGLTVSALLRFQNRRWTLVDYAIGATDVWYCGFERRDVARLFGC